MAELRVCPLRAGIELADVVRRFGPQYTAQYGERMMPSQEKAVSDIAACCTPELEGRLYRCDDKDVRPPGMIAGLVEAFSELIRPPDQPLAEAAEHDAVPPRCPHCGSCRVRLLGEYPRSGVP